MGTFSCSLRRKLLLVPQHTFTSFLFHTIVLRYHPSTPRHKRATILKDSRLNVMTYKYKYHVGTRGHTQKSQYYSDVPFPRFLSPLVVSSYSQRDDNDNVLCVHAEESRGILIQTTMFSNAHQVVVVPQTNQSSSKTS